MENKLDTYLEAYQGKSIYDFDNEILLNWYPKRIIELIDDPENKSLLELGVGHGFSTNVFSKIFKIHLVLDGSKAVIDNFNANYPDCKAEIVETYFENYTSEEKFDVIVLGFILEHVDNPVEILAKYRDFLAPNGKMYLAVPNAEVLNRRLGNLAGMLDDMESLSNNDILLGHQRYYTVKTLSDDIQKSGYKIAKLEGIYLKPLSTQQMVSLNLNKELINSFCKVGIDYPELSCGILAEVSNN